MSARRMYICIAVDDDIANVITVPGGFQMIFYGTPDEVEAKVRIVNRALLGMTRQLREDVAFLAIPPSERTAVGYQKGDRVMHCQACGGATLTRNCATTVVSIW